MIHWHLSGGIYKFDTLQRALEIYRDPRDVYVLYDGLPGNILESGREPLPYWDDFIASRGGLEKILDVQEKNHLHFSLLLSTHLAEPKHLDHPLVAQYLSLFHRPGNSIVVGTDQIVPLLREKYPKYQLIYSIISSYLDDVPKMNPFQVVKYYERKFLLYDTVVAPTQFIYQMEYLQLLDRDRTEFLINDGCNFHCDRKFHYTVTTQHILREDPRHCGTISGCIGHSDYEEHDGFGSEFRCRPEFFWKLLDLGFYRFKLQGREYNVGKYEVELLRSFHWIYQWKRMRNRGFPNHIIEGLPSVQSQDHSKREPWTL